MVKNNNINRFDFRGLLSKVYAVGCEDRPSYRAPNTRSHLFFIATDRGPSVLGLLLSIFPTKKKNHTHPKKKLNVCGGHGNTKNRNNWKRKKIKCVTVFYNVVLYPKDIH